jgi:outer membrane immunogenic protein
MLRFVVSSATAALLSSAAMAADLPMLEVPPAAEVVAAYDWTGFYVGGFGGWAFGESQGSNTPPFGGFDDGGPITIGVDPEGGFVGGTLGFNWQRNWLVLGVEGEGGFNWADDSTTVGDDFGEVEYGWYGAITGRVGFAANRALFYGEGGAVFAEIEETYADLDAGVIDPTDLGSDDDTELGWVVGGGIEFALTQHVTVKGEYNFTFFDDDTLTNGDGDTFDTENELHTGKFGINYKF